MADEYFYHIKHNFPSDTAAVTPKRQCRTEQFRDDVSELVLHLHRLSSEYRGVMLQLMVGQDKDSAFALSHVTDWPLR